MQIDIRSHAARAGISPKALSRLMFPKVKKKTGVSYISYLQKGKRLELLTMERILIICITCDIPPYFIFNVEKETYLNTLNDAKLTRESELKTINKLIKLSQ